MSGCLLPINIGGFANKESNGKNEQSEGNKQGFNIYFAF